MSGLHKAIGFSRQQLRLLRKYGSQDEQEGAQQLDAWLEQLAVNQGAAQLLQAAGFARRDPAATAATPEQQTGGGR